MWNRTIGLAVITLAVWTTQARAADPAGYVLLDKTVGTFERMARQGSSAADLESALAEMMALAKKARAEKRIDEAFFARYTRLIRILRLTTLSDPEGILAPTIEREVTSFVGDVSGQPSSDIGKLAEAMSVELDSLKNVLDASK